MRAAAVRRRAARDREQDERGGGAARGRRLRLASAVQRLQESSARPRRSADERRRRGLGAKLRSRSSRAARHRRRLAIERAGELAQRGDERAGRVARGLLARHRSELALDALARGADLGGFLALRLRCGAASCDAEQRERDRVERTDEQPQQRAAERALSTSPGADSARSASTSATSVSARAPAGVLLRRRDRDDVAGADDAAALDRQRDRIGVDRLVAALHRIEVRERDRGDLGRRAR